MGYLALGITLNIIVVYNCFSFHSYHFISYWLVGLPSASYLAFISRPSFGLEGLWYGYLTATGMLTALMLFTIICIDWNKESLRASGRREQLQTMSAGSEEDNSYRLIFNSNYINLSSKEFVNDEADDMVEIERVELGFIPENHSPLENVSGSLSSKSPLHQHISV